MKKAANILIGFIAGAIFMISAQTYGAGTLTGAKVDGQKNVKVNDKSIGTAAVIDGTSYVPLRAIADELKMQVSVSNGGINLTTTSPQGTDKEARMNELITKRTIIQNNITSTQNNIDGLTTNVIPSLQNATTKLDKQRLEIAQSHLANFQKQLAELNQQLAEVNNQIAALESE